MGILGAFSLQRNPSDRGAYIQGTLTPFRPFGRATRASRADSDIFLPWSSIGSLTIDKQYLSMFIDDDDNGEPLATGAEADRRPGFTGVRTRRGRDRAGA